MFYLQLYSLNLERIILYNLERNIAITYGLVNFFINLKIGYCEKAIQNMKGNFYDRDSSNSDSDSFTRA